MKNSIQFSKYLFFATILLAFSCKNEIDKTSTEHDPKITPIHHKKTKTNPNQNYKKGIEEMADY